MCRFLSTEDAELPAAFTSSSPSEEPGGQETVVSPSPISETCQHWSHVCLPGQPWTGGDSAPWWPRRLLHVSRPNESGRSGRHHPPSMRRSGTAGSVWVSTMPPLSLQNSK